MSRVFPVFFLLVAALVCITTMTRMVEEERTQIGTMKALATPVQTGRSSGNICSTPARRRCWLHVWHRPWLRGVSNYSLERLFHHSEPDQRRDAGSDWGLCIPVAVIYILVSLAVTWYCCRRTLEEVPAELIRPKPPTSGKKILLEYLPFWKNISFLNKGHAAQCIPLPPTASYDAGGHRRLHSIAPDRLRLGDSIKNIVSFQYEEVTKYDIDVRFTDGQDESAQEAFRTAMADSVSDVCFLYQSSMALDFGSKTKDVTMLVGGSGLGRAMDFHRIPKASPCPRTERCCCPSASPRKWASGQGTP